MSYEGYIRKLCEVGHLTEVDCYEDSFRCCPECGRGFAWQEGIDTTNDNGEDQVTKLEVETPTEVCVCDKCNSIHVRKRPTYRIPRSPR